MSHDAGGRINIKRERKLFLVFLKMSVTRCEQLNRHNKVKENIFHFLDFLFLNFVIFYNFQIYFKNEKKKTRVQKMRQK